jgi:hypothetical protein
VLSPAFAASGTRRAAPGRAPALRRVRAVTAETVGVLRKIVIRATGNPLPALAESGRLPAGLRFTDNADGTAVIHGVPAPGSSGSYALRVTAANTVGTTSETFTLQVTGPPAITSAAAAAALRSTSKAGTGAAARSSLPRRTVPGR